MAISRQAQNIGWRAAAKVAGTGHHVGHHVHMVVVGVPSAQRPRPQVFSAKPLWRTAHGVCLLLFLMFCLPGCGGCSKTPEEVEQEKKQAEEKAGKKKEKEKDPFEAQRPAVVPSGKDFLAGACKPGHWISQVWPEVKSNRGDFQGELLTEIADRSSQKLPLSKAYELTTERPAPLAKEQPKSLESFAWIPPEQNAYAVNFKLAAGGGGSAVMEQFMALQRMPSYRYCFVVLSSSGRPLRVS